MTSMGIDLALRIGIGSAALIVLLPYLWRLNPIKWRTHLWRVVAMHLSWAMWLGGVVFEAVFDAPGPANWTDALGVAGAGLWIAVSWRSWRNGPPEYTESGRMPLDDAPRSSLDHAKWGEL